MAGRLFSIFLVLCLLTSPARADWYEASSDHFVIYADQSEKQVRDFSERLERFHSAVNLVLGIESAKPSPSNRVTVYVVQNAGQVRKLFGEGNRYVAGFYVPRAGGTLAIVPRISAADSDLELSGITVLLHEYTHHVMHGRTSLSYPLWYSEGFAEFFAAASFEKDGSVILGRPALHRAYELALATNVPIERLLDTKAYLANKEKNKSYDEFYGRSWSLYHYLTFSEDRKGQINRFLGLVREGKPEIDAATEVFGDLKVLDKELGRYVNQRKLTALVLPPDRLKTGEVAVRKLDAAESAIMPLRIRSKRGVDEETAKELLAEFRPVVAKFPDSVPVLSALAEAEFDAGNDDTAIAAADKALAIDPNNINALIQKGNALVRKAENATDGKKAWADVRKHYLKINEIENDHPVPLMRFYESYAKNGTQPTRNALDGLVWAMQLAPFDQGLRMTTGDALIQAERYGEAIIVLEQLAKDGHNEAMAQIAQQLIDAAKEKQTMAPNQANAKVVEDRDPK